MSKSPPTAEAGGPYTTDEGTNVRLDGSASSDPDNVIVSRYESSFTATDNEGGSAVAKVNVIIEGNSHPNRPHGYWKQQFRSYVVGLGPSDFDAATLTCYLKVAGYMSRVFSEEASAETFAQAYAILDTGPTKPIRQLFDSCSPRGSISPTAPSNMTGSSIRTSLRLSRSGFSTLD